VGLVYLIYKLLDWSRFSAGTAPLVIGIFFFSSVQLMAVGILGEYIGAIHTPGPEAGLGSRARADQLRMRAGVSEAGQLRPGPGVCFELKQPRKRMNARFTAKSLHRFN
jgi:hypothetical protein